MKPPNHACFEAAMADILNRAYQAFPAPIDIHFDETYHGARAADKIPDHCSVRFDPNHSLYGSTLDFLVREGVLVAAEKDSNAASGIVLTSKGFLILSKPIESLIAEDVPTIGQHLGKAGSKAGKDILSSVISHTVGMLVASIVR